MAIDAPCSGNGACGKMPRSVKERRTGLQKTLHISDEEYQKDWRLACVSKVNGDVEVLVPDIASAYKSRMKVADLSSTRKLQFLKTRKRKVQTPAWN